MKRILKSKRGVAIETAVMFMTVIFFFSILLTSVVLYVHLHARAEDKVFQTRLQLDQIGEYFLCDTDEKTDFENAVQAKGYTYNIENNTLTLKNASGNVILYIQRDGNGNALCWRYSEP